MVNRENVLVVLDGVLHPEGGLGLVAGGFVEGVEVSEGEIGVVLRFRRVRDPFAGSLRRQAEGALRAAFPGVGVTVEVAVPEEVVAGKEDSRRLAGVERVVVVASGKGGVGKSTVTRNLALALVAEGYRVGVLDADIYGPSQPVLFGVEGYLPVAEVVDGVERIVPAEAGGVKIMSIGFFIAPSDALVWRGPMAVNALKQLIGQTAWGGLDFLLIDLPPGTGDVHLSVVKELEIDGAIIVTTPGRLSVADVRRGVEMFRAEGVGVPVLGLVENMAWFSPVEMPDNKYYIFGEGGGRRFAETEGIEFLGEIPVVMAAGERVADDVAGKRYFEPLARRIVDKVSKEC